jgi:hypothetical protein
MRPRRSIFSVCKAARWNKLPVTTHFTGTDVTSGIGSCSPDATVSSEGMNQSSPTGTCTDKAGNVSTGVTATGINIDLTPPVVAASAGPAPNASGWNTTPVTVAFSGTDALSGLAPNGCTAPVIRCAVVGSADCHCRTGLWLFAQQMCSSTSA